MKIEFTYSALPVKVEINEGVNYTLDDSGSGKTLFFTIFNDYCKTNNITCILCNSHNINTEEDIIDICRKYSVVLFDNADLYVTKHVIEELTKSCKYIILSLKNMLGLGLDTATDIDINYGETLEVSIIG